MYTSELKKVTQKSLKNANARFFGILQIEIILAIPANIKQEKFGKIELQTERKNVCVFLFGICKLVSTVTWKPSRQLVDISWFKKNNYHPHFQIIII